MPCSIERPLLLYNAFLTVQRLSENEHTHVSCKDQVHHLAGHFELHV